MQSKKVTERTGPLVKVKKDTTVIDVETALAKANPTTKDVMIVLKAIWERG